jgi:predicted amidophosphoribosyltransferase
VPLLLSKKICEHTKLALSSNCLEKQYKTPPQHTLTRTERLANLIGAYGIRDSKAIKNKTVLLCDDILTTGATLNECAKTLKIYGANRVYAVAFAATPPHKQKEREPL